MTSTFVERAFLTAALRRDLGRPPRSWRELIVIGNPANLRMTSTPVERESCGLSGGGGEVGRPPRVWRGRYQRQRRLLRLRLTSTRVEIARSRREGGGRRTENLHAGVEKTPLRIVGNAPSCGRPPPRGDNASEAFSSRSRDGIPPRSWRPLSGISAREIQGRKTSTLVKNERSLYRPDRDETENLHLCGEDPDKDVDPESTAGRPPPL